MLTMKDFELPDGTVDWPAMRAAERAAGHRCRRCDDLILWPDPKTGICGDCQGLEGREEIWSDNGIRCPACGEIHRIYNLWERDIHEEGTHEMYCSECDHLFEIETMVTRSYKSPERR